MSASARHPAALATLCLASLLAACSRSAPGGADTASAAAAEAEAAATDVTVEVALAGSGEGQVISDVGGIDCPGNCSAVLPPGTVVSLTASAPTGTRFLGWGGVCSGIDVGQPCAVAATPGLVVPVAFESSGPLAMLGVSRIGSGVGLVTSTPAGVQCGATCTAFFPADTAVTLTASAVPGTGSTFVGWDGPCTGTEPTCVVTVSDLQVVNVRFDSPERRYTLDVVRRGAGRGAVVAEGRGIDCGALCAQGFAEGAVINLTATAESGSYFVGWGGVCAGEGPTCTVTKDTSQQDVIAFFETTGPAYTLAVESDAAGSERAEVMSSAFEIRCGQFCSGRFAAGAVVTLTASTRVAATFLGWGGDCSGTEPTCVVPMSQDRVVTAAFEVLPTRHLVVEALGDGSIAAPEWYFLCWGNSACDLEVPAGVTIALTASPSDGSVFSGWGGDCAGTGPCFLSMTEDHVATASFAPAQPVALTVARSGIGAGRVTSSPAGIDCGDVCSAMFPSDTIVTLTATPSPGSSFAGWMGPCSGTAPCLVPMSQARAVTAAFTALITDSSLTVTVTGPGPGRITSTPAGIDCGATCSASFASGTVVTLTATNAGSVFIGWSGACTGTGPCVVSLSAATSVTANFAAPPPSAGCQVTYRVVRQSHGGFIAALAIRNTGAAAWNGWTVTWSWPTAGQRILHAWNATASQSGQAVTLRNARRDGAIPAGASYSEVRLIGRWKGSNPSPTAFAVNGVPCN